MTKARHATSAAKQIVSESKFREAKSENDTVKLWENYREQALLWRAIAIFQMPATFIALSFALVMYNNRSIELDVPAKPLPGYYMASEISDEEFLGRAIEFVNLIASYQPETAKNQFKEASKFLLEPMLTRFHKEMIMQELEAIKNIRRTQIYFMDPTKTEIIRDHDNDQVIVTLVGTRKKIVAGEEVPTVSTLYRVTMTTIPRNKLNQYGIMITNVEVTSSKNVNDLL
ncbi:MAG: hypothetical protein KDD62_07760 [Bdellovibrionales bacterium]|nr:hypothetical protein [Bdellovibrionales bacterium]